MHPRSSQYRWMKSEWRANVYLARSRIQVSVQSDAFSAFWYGVMWTEWIPFVCVMCSQGLGLFAARDIEKQTMVIEYNGTVLRNEVAVSKEKIYKSQVFIWFEYIKSWNSPSTTIGMLILFSPRQNRTVFMFRIDSEHVVDATRTGGLARYCEIPLLIVTFLKRTFNNVVHCPAAPNQGHCSSAHCFFQDGALFNLLRLSCPSATKDTLLKNHFTLTHIQPTFKNTIT